MNKAPTLSYWICSTPRVGSTLLSHLLASTGVAGKPEEFFLEENVEIKKDRWGVELFDEYLNAVLQKGSSPNGVFGVKMSPGVVFRYLEDQIRTIPKWSHDDLSIYEMLNSVFPNLKFIWLTRRNKVRQAVSWWKAAQSSEWGRFKDEESRVQGKLEYVFESIDHLFNESAMLDASWQDHFDNWNVHPLTLVYEDYVNDLKGTVEEVLSYSGIDDAYEFQSSKIRMAIQANRLSEEWVQWYKEEKQREWPNVAWSF
jgi:LPS sulfotransferase NodH